MRIPRLVLRRENVDTNRLTDVEVADRTRDEDVAFDWYVVMMRSDARSGIRRA
jgi:hypothetical protein